jgi:tRNA G18 (ribose-2'-O)-methylase SpoU
VENDQRNVIDKYKFVPNDEIIADLDKSRLDLQVAIENFEHDFNIGTVIRNANAFSAMAVHIIGKKHYNRRGAMVTDKYLHIFHHPDIASFVKEMQRQQIPIIAIDNVPGATALHEAKFPKRCVLLYGSEGPGISPEGLASATMTVAIEQFGSTRSINVGVASGISMYVYVQQNVL